MAATHTRGCVVLERPDLIQKLVEDHGARDTTVRGTAIAELEAMETRPSQYNPGSEIPEKSLAYRLAKRIAFHDYGVYTKHFRQENWKDTRQQTESSEPELVQLNV